MWSYPGVDGVLRDLLVRKCTLDQEAEGEGSSRFGRFSQSWYYLKNFHTPDNNKLPKVSYLTTSSKPILECKVVCIGIVWASVQLSFYFILVLWRIH